LGRCGDINTPESCIGFGALLGCILMPDSLDLPIDRIADAVVQRLEGRFNGIDSRFDRLEGQMDLMAVKLIDLDEKVNVLQSDMTIVKHEVGEIHNRLDESVAATKRNEEEIVMTQARCERIEERVSVLEGVH
jgi:chromosome segregation ATPase